MKKISNLLWGIVLIVIGIILGLNSLEVTDIDLLFDGWWTLFIIIPSFIGLLSEREKIGNLIGIIIGVALLLCSQDILDFDMVWKLILPVILILFGLSLVFKDMFNRKIVDEKKRINQSNKGNDTFYAIFSEQKVNIEEEFIGNNIISIFGDVKMDLTDAKINDDLVINCITVFGGIELIVPDSIKIKIKSMSIFGGVDENKKKKENEDCKTIYIDAKCIFGEVDIK